jgi:SAM-dependent methyltransferase
MTEGDLIRRIYEDYDAYQFREYIPTSDVSFDNPRFWQVLRLVGKGKRVLDIGCSRGDFALFLTQHGNEVVGLDISEKAVSLCRARGIEAFRVNVEVEPLPEIGDFDVVLMLELVEHLIDPLPVLRKVRGVLKSTGFLILSTPNAAYYKWRLQLLKGRIPDFGENRFVSAEPRPYNLLHKTPLAIPDLQELLYMAGFSMDHIEPEDYRASSTWSMWGLHHLRNWLRKAWPSMFAGNVVVKASPV